MNSEQKDKILRGLGFFAFVLLCASVPMVIIGFWDDTASAVGLFFLIIGWILFGLVLFIRNRRNKKPEG